MNRNLLPCCLLAAGLALYSAESFSQEGGGDYEPPPHPQGFMIEGLLSQSIYTVDPSSFTILNAIAVPNAILGYKMRAVAIGLGVAFYRASYKTETMGGVDLTNRTAYTSMMFMPRFEITIYRSKSGVAEAYLPLSIGVGFHIAKDKTEGMIDDERTDSDVVLGAHAGLGARAFLGGSPFALGAEFGWSGSWAHMKDWDDDDENNWSGVHGIYGSITGTFVFD